MVDYMGALYDLIVECLTLAKLPLAADRIYRAWPNRVALPKGDNEFAVMTPISLVRRGTNVERYDGVKEVVTLWALYLADVQVDFWGGGDKCLERAMALEIMARSPLSIGFMRERDLKVGVIDCPGGVKDLTTTGDADQYVRRAVVTIQLEFWNSLEAEQWGTLGPLLFEYFENVDVHHPPKGDD
jgi:hypothetical protein